MFLSYTEKHSKFLKKNNDQGLQADVFILDFAKAFDSVPHERINKSNQTFFFASQSRRTRLSWFANRSNRCFLFTNQANGVILVYKLG